MKRTPTMVKALNDIDTALEVSMATVVTAGDSTEDERISWILIGVADQLKTIRNSLTSLDAELMEM